MQSCQPCKILLSLLCQYCCCWVVASPCAHHVEELKFALTVGQIFLSTLHFFVGRGGDIISAPDWSSWSFCQACMPGFQLLWPMPRLQMLVNVQIQLAVGAEGNAMVPLWLDSRHVSVDETEQPQGKASRIASKLATTQSKHGFLHVSMSSPLHIPANRAHDQKYSLFRRTHKVYYSSVLFDLRKLHQVPLHVVCEALLAVLTCGCCEEYPSFSGGNRCQC